MSDRRPPEITESIAEALRAGLALLAVVLLVRANAGAFTRTPSVWVGLLVGLIVWGTAAWAARWTRLAGVSRLAVWRDCVAPATISLVMAGRGGAGTLPMAIGILVLGSLAVGFAAGYYRTNLQRSDQVLPESISVPALQPMSDRESEAPAEPHRGDGSIPGSRLSKSYALPLDTESAQGDRMSEGGQPCGECSPLNTPASDAIALNPLDVPAPTALAEIVESSIDAPSPVESWTRMESDGDVSIEAVIQARFEEGSKRAVVHLPFVPPLPSVPQIECEPLDSGCEVEIQTEAAYRHGARLSVTRPTAGPAESVPIGVVVYTSAEEPIES
jgi:hypothetical protein